MDEGSGVWDPWNYKEWKQLVVGEEINGVSEKVIGSFPSEHSPRCRKTYTA